MAALTILVLSVCFSPKVSAPGLFLFLILALLVGYTAACFASGLAGCLAFAAAALFGAFAEILGFKSFDVFHYYYLLYCIIFNNFITFDLPCQYVQAFADSVVSPAGSSSFAALSFNFHSLNRKTAGITISTATAAAAR